MPIIKYSQNHALIFFPVVRYIYRNTSDTYTGLKTSIFIKLLKHLCTCPVCHDDNLLLNFVLIGSGDTIQLKIMFDRHYNQNFMAWTIRRMLWTDTSRTCNLIYSSEPAVQIAFLHYNLFFYVREQNTVNWKLWRKLLTGYLHITMNNAIRTVQHVWPGCHGGTS